VIATDLLLMVAITSLIVYAVATSKPKPPTPEAQEEIEHLIDTIQAKLERQRGKEKRELDK
jgi:hypothetical protein